MQSKYLHLCNKPAWPIYEWKQINPLLGKDVFYNWHDSFIHNSAKTQQKSKGKMAELKKIILIALTFNANIAWVESKVYIHMQKTAEPGTNMHAQLCSLLTKAALM